MTVRNNLLIERIVELQKPLGYNYFRVEAEYQLFCMLGIFSSTDERIDEMHQHAVDFIESMSGFIRSQVGH